MKWLIRKIENSSLFDKYMSSGKKNKTCYTEETVEANYNVFNCYDSQCCKPKFYDGHLEEDFDIQESSSVEESLDTISEIFLADIVIAPSETTSADVL